MEQLWDTYRPFPVAFWLLVAGLATFAIGVALVWLMAIVEDELSYRRWIREPEEERRRNERLRRIMRRTIHGTDK